MVEGIVLDSSQPFDASKWIGRGVKWSDDLPPEVLNARDALLEVPPEDYNSLPSPSCSVAQLLEAELPEQSSKLNLTKPMLWFKSDRPFTPVDRLANRTLPSEKFLREVVKHVGQAMLDGNQSISDPDYNDGQDRFPIHSLSFMIEATQTAKGRERWMRGNRWLVAKEAVVKDEGVRAVLGEARRRLANISWNSKLSFAIQPVTTLDLSDFLSTTWLKDDHVDMMLEVLRDRLVKDGLSDIIIAPMSFSWTITAAARENDFSKKGLVRYANKIRTEKIRQLYFPLNVNGNHWVAGCIDFENHSIVYGDSLAQDFSPPTGFLLVLRKWFKHTFGRDITVRGDTLDHGLQDDTYSCGICAVNTIAHAVFNDPLWVPRMKVFHRVQWFLDLAEYQCCTLAMPIPPKPSTEEENTELEGDIVESVLNALPDFNFSTVPQPQNVHTRSHIALSELLNPSSREIEVASARLGLDELLDPVESDGDDDDGSVDGKGTGKKRLFQQDETEGEDDIVGDSDEDEDDEVVGRKEKSANVGISRTATRAREMNARVKEGSFAPDPKLLERWKNRLRHYDPEVGFDTKDPLKIKSFHHSLCNTWHEVKCPYDTTRFFEHLAVCTEEYRKKKKGAGSERITSFFAAKGPQKSNKSKKTQAKFPAVPCPGWTDADDSRTSRYLFRSGARGGGAPSLYKIAKNLYQKPFSDISTTKRKHCLDVQEHALVWLNQHAHLRIFHHNCLKEVSNNRSGRILPCFNCLSLRKNRRFQAVLRRKTPLEQNIRFTNFRWRNELIGHLHLKTVGMKDLIEAIDQKHSPLVRFTMGMLKGKYKDEHLAGLIEALVIRRDREQRGVGLQGIQYPPAWDELCHLIQVSSPKTYRLLQNYFPMRSERSWRIKHARQPRFPPDICNETFRQLRTHLAVISYRGQPCALCCDDTKLMPRLRVYYDSSAECHFVVGSDAGPIKVMDPDELEKVMKDHDDRKATKIRLWVITPCIPGVTPILLAAKAIPNTMDAATLTSYSMEIIRGLIKEGVNVVSYACDGTEVERGVQRRIISQADEIVEFTISSPCEGGKDLAVKFAIIHGQPVAVIQDSKHGLKTFRNNIFSGARLLCFGNDVAVYEFVREVAHEDRSPIYIRDVERLDRQDDAAATRLFSADMLEYVCDAHPEHVLLILLLFVFGDFIDAFQNRRISHHERVRMVLRARYFIDYWETFLSVSGYHDKRYCLSREALDIARILIEGYLALIVIHRDYQNTDAGISPFIPWLHSSEPNEHAFGDTRVLISNDFDFLDFIYGAPKVQLQMGAAVRRGKPSDSKARAAGYHHTYFDVTGIDLVVLGTFPTHEEIEDIARQALGDVESCVQLLGMSKQQFQWARRSFPTLKPTLPSFAAFEKELEAWKDDSDEETCSDDGEDEDAVGRLDEMFRCEEDSINRPNYTEKEEEAVKGLLCAGMSLVTERMIEIQQLADVNEEEEAEAQGRDFEAVQAFEKAVSNVKHSLPDELSKPLGQGHTTLEDISYSALVDLRRQNQTLQAALGTRTSTTRKPSTTQSLSQQILDRYNTIRRESRDREYSSAGQNRAARWTTAPKGDGSHPTTLSGNSANAAVSAAASIKKAAVRRHAIFKAHLSVRDGHFPLISNARVTPLRPLRRRDYGIVWVDGSLLVGKVLALYEKTGGKNGRYASVTQTSNITAAAYIDLQVFERGAGRRFTNVTSSTVMFGVNQFIKIPSQQFLVLLNNPSHPTPTGNAGGHPTNLLLQPSDYELFEWLRASQGPGVAAAMMKFRKRPDEEED
ncbi:hypothetical protein PQX77_015048 [Marasmius sp. AFHP31]|nr:hypothetical protein PQX77_015048 [Marasmius sp. AFHP31]